MHHLFGTNNFAAKGLTNTLVPQTDAQNRNSAGESVNAFNTDSSLIGRAGAGGDNNFFRS